MQRSHNGFLLQSFDYKTKKTIAGTLTPATPASLIVDLSAMDFLVQRPTMDFFALGPHNGLPCTALPQDFLVLLPHNGLPRAALSQ